jgi:ferrous iron transport protein B
MVVGQVFRRALFRGEAMPFVMELPPYRIPLFRSVLIHMWDRAAIFIRKVGGIILIASIVIWVLCSFPRGFPGSEQFRERINQLEENGIRPEEREGLAQLRLRFEEERLQHSYGGRVGGWISPILRPMGLDWKAGLALVTGVAAKETVVSTLGILYRVDTKEREGEEGLGAALRHSGLTPASALAMMVIVLIYVPCFGTLAVIRHESGSWRWTFLAVVYPCLLAWVTAYAVFQIGTIILSYHST